MMSIHVKIADATVQLEYLNKELQEKT